MSMMHKTKQFSLNAFNIKLTSFEKGSDYGDVLRQKGRLCGLISVNKTVLEVGK